MQTVSTLAKQRNQLISSTIRNQRPKNSTIWVCCLRQTETARNTMRLLLRAASLCGLFEFYGSPFVAKKAFKINHKTRRLSSSFKIERLVAAPSKTKRSIRF